jgi:hypothetical protein
MKNKLFEMYPEIKSFALKVDLGFDQEKNVYVVAFSKGDHSRHAFLDKGDADSCIEGNARIYLGVLIAQYIKTLKKKSKGNSYTIF